jgi:hypothetical protein
MKGHVKTGGNGPHAGHVGPIAVNSTSIVGCGMKLPEQLRGAV